ncbi:hypothetical protein GNY06_01785 [Elizabethkingia argentiflava]|uniref:Uncharacterized protein n=1 Tax=Elizabethkingia argenteiflava TaxID=2681556 RepID=A0A845PPA7_9FLAO|nr:hypothetical protein [Elizabethkingia argenteiflava]NAW50169.1 hypothetical protein [Elizabethkingia argenteiflava]
MKKFILPFLVFGSIALAQKQYITLVHGNIENTPRTTLSTRQEEECDLKLFDFLQKGYRATPARTPYETLQETDQETDQETLQKIKKFVSSGGLIALDKNAHPSTPFNDV